MRLYWAPGTRSLRALWMLEEVVAPYERVLVDIRNGGQHTPEFHAVNPMEKVPAIELDGACVAESGAICAFLAEKFRRPRWPRRSMRQIAGATGNGCSSASPISRRRWWKIRQCATADDGGRLGDRSTRSSPCWKRRWPLRLIFSVKNFPPPM